MPERLKMLNPIQSFQLFCLESYRSARNISGKNALTDFKKYNVFSFLKSGFDVLHTQSQHYILSEINRFIKQRHESLPR